MKQNNPNSSNPVKTVHVLLLFSLLAAQTLAQVPPPSPNAATNNATAAINAASTNVAITATNLDARRKALLRSITNRAPRLNTNATVLPALQVPVAATNIVAAPATNVNPAANVAAQVAPPAPGNPLASPTPLPTPSNLASPGQAESAEFSFKFYNTPVDQIFEEYSEITGRTVLRSASLAATPVTIITASPLTRKEAIQALDGALSLNGIAMLPQGEKFVKAVLATEAPLHGAAISKLQDGEYPDAEQFVTHIVQLKIAKPSELQPLLQTFTRIQGGIVPIESNQILVIRDYASNIKRMLELIQQIDVTPESDYKLEVIPIRYGKVTDLYETMNALVSGGGGGGAYPGAARTSATTPQRRAGQLPGAGGALGTSGRYGGFGSRGGTTYGQPQANQPLTATGAQPGATAGTSFQDRLRQIVNRAAGASEVQLLADARIVPDERYNSLIVYANKEDMKMLTNIVSKVDVLLAQVLIEGVVLSVSLNDENNLGVSWLQKPISFGKNTIGTGGINNGPGFLTNIASIASSLSPGFSYFGALGKNFDVSLNALATSGRVRILQRPRIQTSHATLAAFFSGSTVPFVTGVNNYGYIGTGIQSSTIEQVQVGVTLSVTPFITPDGLVVMDIDQDISSIDKTVTIDGNPVPQTATRHATATLSVRDNETIMLGGYIEDNRLTSKSGVPILKDIPLLGALFRTRNNNKTRSELLLLMHVSILRNPMDSGAQLEAEKARMPGIFEADKEFKETEEQSLKKAGLPPQQH